MRVAAEPQSSQRCQKGSAATVPLARTPMRVSFGPISDVGAFLNEVSPTPTNGHHAEGRPGPKSAPDSKVAALFNGADEPGPDDRIHDGSGGHQPGTARAGSHEPRQIASHSGPERNLPRRLPLAFVSLTVGPHPQGLQALQLKRRAACRSLFSECAHSSPELRLT